MKQIAGILLVLAIFLVSIGQALAISRDAAVQTYTNELTAPPFNLPQNSSEDRAEREVDSLIQAMESEQYDVKVAIENLDTQVSALSKNSDRQERALSAIDTAKDRASNFMDLEANTHVKVQVAVAGALPYVTQDGDFVASQDSANTAIGVVRRIMIAPDRPGSVPSGDIVTDFIPQIIRQLFRFAWVAVFIALTASGVMLIMAQGNDERLTKAKSMIYFTLIGFAFVAMAFAIVKGVTDIDFFRIV